MLNSSPVNQIAIENLLGKSIGDAEKLFKTDFRIFSHDIEKVYFSDFPESRELYDTPYNSILLHLDESNNIDVITIHFTKYVDDSFYNSITSQYGDPTRILAIKSKDKIDEVIAYSDAGEETRSITESRLTMKEVTLKENPLFIYWIKENFNIKILNKKGFLSTSDLTFRLPTEEF